MKAAFTLLLLCGVVLYSNYRLKRLSGEVAKAVQSIYEDRLLVQDIIYSFDGVLDGLRKQKFSDKPFAEYISEVKELEDRYAQTVLTTEEKKLLNLFSIQMENALMNSVSIQEFEILDMKSILNRLERIQVEEAKKQMVIIDRASGRQRINFYFETAILVVLLVIVQVLVVSSAGLKHDGGEDKYHLN